MKSKYKLSIKRLYGYCRWNHEFPPDNWCLIGIYQWWFSPEMFRYSLCFFGFELRIDIDRKFITP